MGKYTHKKPIYGGIPPTPPPLPPLYKKTTQTLENEKKFEKRLKKLYQKMKEEEEDEILAEREDSLMLWAVRGTGKKFEPISKRWKTVVSQSRSKKNGGKKIRKTRKTRKHKMY